MPIPLTPKPDEPGRWWPYNVNFCLFAECIFLDNGEEWDCTRSECILTKYPLDWWEMSLQPYPLISSNPPAGCYKVTELYMQKTGNKYHPVFVIDNNPVP